MSESFKVLVVDDDADIRDLLEDYLAEHGYEVRAAASGSEARSLLDQGPPDVALLDIGLPGEDGLSLARHLREHHDVAIIMVSGAGETVDRIVGLEVGADDYVSKPFDPRELLARIKSVLRRYQRSTQSQPANETSQAQGDRRVAIGRCSLNLDSRQLVDDEGNEVPLTAMEFELLEVFSQRPNRPMTRDQLLNLTQNRDWDPYDRSIDIRIARLRRKIEVDPQHPRTIKTVRGVGYMFVPGNGA